MRIIVFFDVENRISDEKKQLGMISPSLNEK